MRTTWLRSCSWQLAAGCPRRPGRFAPGIRPQDPRFAAGMEPEGERATLLDYLRGCRLTMQMKCAARPGPARPSAGAALCHVPARPHPPHGRRRTQRVPPGDGAGGAPPLYRSGDLADADRAGAAAGPAVAGDARQAWRDEVAFARGVAGFPGLGVRGTMPDEDTIALREVLARMIQEYARHRATPACCGNGSTDAPARDSGKPARSLLPDHTRTTGAQHAMSHAYRFRHATAPSRSPSFSVVGAAPCLTCDIRYARLLDRAGRDRAARRSG